MKSSQFLAPCLLIAAGIATAKAAPPTPPAIAQIARNALPAVVDIESIDPMKAHGPSGVVPGRHHVEKSAAQNADTNTLIVPPKAEQALGTGFFISPKGYIVTNHHVIAGASEIKVTLRDGRIFTARLVGADKKADLAVLKIHAAKPTPYLTFGDSGKLDLGDWVVAIGNPFGLGFSVSAGVVSALHRDIGSGPYDNFIQTDAAINRGNSGGPMLDAQGKVIGVDSAIYSPSGGSVGIGFAIPSSMVEPVAHAIIENGAMRRGWLGLRIEHVSSAMRKAWHLPSTDGVVVGGVASHGPATGKLEPADVITAIDGKSVKTVHGFKVATAEIPVGQMAHLRYRIGGEFHNIAIMITAPPKPAAEMKHVAATPPKPRDISALGIGVMAHPGKTGVVVMTVSKGSAAARAGLRPDSLIQAVGSHFVKTPEDLARHIGHQGAVTLLVDGSNGASWLSVPLTPSVKQN